MKRINYLLFVLVLFISFSTITYAKEQEAYIPCELASDGLKIRDINDINNAVGGLSCGTSIKVIEKDVKSDATCSKWYKIKYNNKEYYSCGEYIYIVEDVKLIQEYSKVIFRSFRLNQLARVDFFVTKDENVYFNEVNTMPGFTDISMYPKMLIHDGYSYQEIIDVLIKNAT